MNKIIIGLPRSGTGFCSELFKTNNIDIGHEKFGKDGIISWCLVHPFNEKLYGPNIEEAKQHYKTFEIYHQIRNPIDVISSLPTISDNAFAYMTNALNINNERTIENYIKIYVEWNELCHKITKKWYNVEKIFDTFPFLDDKNNLEKQKVNTRKHDILDLEKIDKKFIHIINEQKEKYGYIKELK